MTSRSRLRAPSRVSPFVGLGVLTVVGITMLSWSWFTWPDPFIDFGRELYVPWQLVCGKVLYRDLAYFNGPLSPYVNALWFRLFTVSLHTLVFCNLAILTILIGALYRIFTVLSDQFAAMVACVMVLMLCAFGQITNVANYNFLCPYSHEMTHGVTLSVAALGSCFGYLRRRRYGYLVGAGGCTGMVFLTKAEIFAPLALTMLMGLVIFLYVERVPPRERVVAWSIFLGAAMVPVGMAFGVLQLAMPAQQAWHGVFGSWPFVLNPAVTSQRFYRLVSGALEMRSNITIMLVWGGWYAAMLIPLALISLAIRPSHSGRGAICAGIVALLAALLIWRWHAIPWGSVARPFPLVLIGVAAWHGWLIRDVRVDPAQRQQYLARFMMTTFALLLLGKIFFRVQWYHYGFALALPALGVIVVALMQWVPARLTAAGGTGNVFRAGVVTCLTAALLPYLADDAQWFARKVHVIRAGSSDMFFADERGAALSAVLDEVARQVQPAQTLAVLPEGAMVNYLSRRSNPTPYISVIPIELIMFGEPRMLASLQAHPPDFILLVPWNGSEYGLRSFGRDFGQQIDAWVQHQYHVIGHVPSPTTQADILFLQRDGLEHSSARVFSDDACDITLDTSMLRRHSTAPPCAVQQRSSRAKASGRCEQSDDGGSYLLG